MSGWDGDEGRLRDVWAATPEPPGLRGSFRAAVERGSAPRRTLRPLAVAVGVAVVLAAGGVALGAHHLADRSSTGPAAPTSAPRVSTPAPVPTTAPTAAPTSAPTPAPTALNSSTWVARHLGDGNVVAMAATPRAMYALVAAPGSSGDARSRTQLVRLDTGGGAPASSAPITLGTSVVVAGSEAWVGTGGSISSGGAPVSGTAQIARYDARTLQPLGTVALHTTGPSAGGPDVTVHLALGAGRVWAVYGPDLFELDAGSGAVTRTIPLEGTVSASDVSVSPSGDRAYTVAEQGSFQVSTLSEWDTSSGAQVAGGSAQVSGLGPSRLGATDAGVWVAFATGTEGQVSFRPSGNLATETHVLAGPHSNQVHAVVTLHASGGAQLPDLWVLDAQTLTCADPVTGATRASMAVTSPVTVASDGGSVYLGSIGGVDLLAPDRLCGA